MIEEPTPQPPTAQPPEPPTQPVREKWYTPLTRVTPLSKALAMALFVILPFVGFWLGVNMRSDISKPSSVISDKGAIMNVEKNSVNNTNYPNKPTSSDLLTIEFIETNAWRNMMPGSYSEHIDVDAHVTNNSTTSLYDVRIAEPSLILDGEQNEGKIYFYVFKANSCDSDLQLDEYIESINIPVGCELTLAFRSMSVGSATRAGLRFSLVNDSYRSEELTTPEAEVGGAY